MRDLQEIERANWEISGSHDGTTLAEHDPFMCHACRQMNKYTEQTKQEIEERIGIN